MELKTHSVLRTILQLAVRLTSFRNLKFSNILLWTLVGMSLAYDVPKMPKYEPVIKYKKSKIPYNRVPREHV